MNIITLPKYNNKVKGKKCVVCGEDAFSHLNGLPYCRRHYLQMKRGGIKERTTRDPNELIDLGSSMKIVLYNKTGQKLSEFGLIDKDDSNLISGKKVGFGKFGEKKYCYLTVSGKVVLLHRFLWESKNGKIPEGKVVDHINGNGLDCRMSNLRLASALENSYNLSKPNKYTGVNPSGDRFTARIMHDRKDYNLGTFPTLKEALDARIEAERKYFGNFGPNVSRYDRGLINYSQNHNFNQNQGQQVQRDYSWAPEFDYGKYINYHYYPYFSNMIRETSAGKDFENGGFTFGGWIPRAVESFKNWTVNDELYKKHAHGNILQTFLRRTGRMPTQNEWKNLTNHSYSNGVWRSVGRDNTIRDGVATVGDGVITLVPGGQVFGGVNLASKMLTKASLLKRLGSLSKSLKSTGKLGKLSVSTGKVALGAANNVIDVAAVEALMDKLKKVPDEEVNKMLKEIGPEQTILAAYQMYSGRHTKSDPQIKLLANTLFNEHDDGNNILRLASSNKEEFDNLLNSSSNETSIFLPEKISKLINNPNSKRLFEGDFERNAIGRFLGEEKIKPFGDPHTGLIYNDKEIKDQLKRLESIPEYKEIKDLYSSMSQNERQMVGYLSRGDISNFLNLYKQGRTEYGYDKDGNIVSRDWNNDHSWWKGLWSNQRGDSKKVDWNSLTLNEKASARFQLQQAQYAGKTLDNESLDPKTLERISKSSDFLNGNIVTNENSKVSSAVPVSNQKLNQASNTPIKESLDMVKKSHNVDSENQEKVEDIKNNLVPNYVEPPKNTESNSNIGNAVALGALALGGLALYNSNKKKKKKKDEDESEYDSEE